MFTLQEKSKDSAPDATITQESFKIAVETKMTDCFYSDQLMRHLEVFGDVKHKVLITLSSVFMANDKKVEFEKKLKEYNAMQKYPVIHINTTFENLVTAIQDVIDDRDYEMKEVLDDYLDYCFSDCLIEDGWKHMRMQVVGKTIKFNVANNICYDIAKLGFRPHEYLGLYDDKRVKYIGKICAQIIAVETENGINCISDFGDITDERRQKIGKDMDDGDTHGYDIRSRKYSCFFVEKFYKTNFYKTTKGGARKNVFFDLSKLLGTEELPSVETIAECLKEKTWVSGR